MRPSPEMIPVLIDTAKTLKGEPATALHGQDGQGHGARRTSLGRGPSRLEPGDDPQGDARIAYAA